MNVKMKVFSVICIVSVFLGCVSPPVKNLDSKGQNIICFGDSITEGSGVARDRSYPAVLSAYLNREVINAGVSGDTTAFALARLEEDVLKKDPFLVIIELGGNDFLQRVPRQETFKNLENIIKQIHRSGAAVALCDISSDKVFFGYSAEFEDLARRTGAIFISGVVKDILGNNALSSDFIHPNAQGYALMAERVYERLSEYYEF